MNKENLIALIIVSVSAYYIWSHFSREDVWTGFVYPHVANLLVHREIGEFSSLSDCRDAALAFIREKGFENPDYECSLNCRPDGYGPSICEETSE